MVSKIKAEDEKSSKLLRSLIPSLPEDVIIDILARSSRWDYPKLSLVSKHFRSLVASPDLYARRSLLACTETCLYAVLYDYDASDLDLDMWYILRRKANGSRCLDRIPIPSTLPVLETCSASSVEIDSRIYVFGGIDRQNMTTNALIMDCRFHTVEPLPSIPVPMDSRLSCIIDNKIYVIGNCNRYPDKAMLVFNIETQMWEHVVTKREMTQVLRASSRCVAMADKIYTVDGYRSYVYEPKESKWEIEDMMSSEYWMDPCVVDNVLYYHDWCSKTLKAYDPNHKCWLLVEGLEELLVTICSNWSYALNYGGNIALLFSRASDIWCAEISLERRQGGKIWGKVEWCGHVLNGYFGIRKFLAVTV